MKYESRADLNLAGFRTIQYACILGMTSLLALTGMVFGEETTDANADLSTATNLPGVPLEDGADYEAVKKLPPAIPRECG